MNLYAKKTGNTVEYKTEQEEGFFPLIGDYTLLSAPAGPLIVFDEVQQAFIVDPALKAQHDIDSAKQQKADRRKSWREFGALFLDEIIELNSSKYESSQITLAELTAMYDDPTMLKIERALKLGDLKAAKALITQFSSTVYTAQEKQALLDKLTAKIGAGV